LAGGFKKFFNIATPAATMDHGILVDTVTTTATATAVTTVNGLAANVITAAAINDGAIDRATFAADTGLQSARSNTAQAGAAGSVTLDASASATTDFYAGAWIYLTGGTGVGQARVCTAYNGATKVATIAPNWATTPDNTSTFAVIPAAQLTGIQGNVTGSVASVTGAVGSVTGAVGSVTAAVSIAVAGIPSGAHAAAELNAIADALLDRNMTTGTDNGTDSTAVRTVRQALRRLRNKESIAAGVLTVTKEDDATASWTAAVTTTAGNPLSAVDPT
jgi:hypothetical protein